MFQLSHKTIQTMKAILHMVFVVVIAFSLLKRAYYSMLSDWLFFLTSDAVENFACALIAYVLYHFVFKSAGSWKRVATLASFIILLLMLASLKDYRIHDRITIEYTFNHFKSFLGQSLLFYLLIFLINNLEFLGRYQKIGKELNQAKEQLLRNQLHPHFLFNAFNSLYSLSLKNDPQTPAYILKLSGMMRYLTDETHLNKVPLHRELDFIEKYLAIEKIRFGQDARIQLTVKNIADHEKWIEPFLLITLVENAFKHGFYTNLKDAFVKIDLHVNNKELVFVVENSVYTKQHFQETNREGKGLRNLKKRLEMLYPKSSAFKVAHTKYTYTAHLKIMLTNEPV